MLSALLQSTVRESPCHRINPDFFICFPSSVTDTMAMGKIICLALALLLTSTTAFSGELATPEGDHVPASLKKLQEKILAREAAKKGDSGIGKSHREKKVNVYSALYPFDSSRSFLS